MYSMLYNGNGGYGWKRTGNTDFARLILKLGNTIIKNRDKHLRQIGLTTEQADSLQFFLYQGQATITELKDHLGVSHQTARGIVRRMEDKALVRTRKSDIDARWPTGHPHGAGQGSGGSIAKERDLHRQPAAERVKRGRAETVFQSAAKCAEKY